MYPSGLQPAKPLQQHVKPRFANIVPHLGFCAVGLVESIGVLPLGPGAGRMGGKLLAGLGTCRGVLLGAGPWQYREPYVPFSLQYAILACAQVEPAYTLVLLYFQAAWPV